MRGLLEIALSGPVLLAMLSSGVVLGREGACNCDSLAVGQSALEVCELSTQDRLDLAVGCEQLENAQVVFDLLNGIDVEELLTDPEAALAMAEAAHSLGKLKVATDLYLAIYSRIGDSRPLVQNEGKVFAIEVDVLASLAYPLRIGLAQALIDTGGCARALEIISEAEEFYLSEELLIVKASHLVACGRSCSDIVSSKELLAQSKSYPATYKRVSYFRQSYSDRFAASVAEFSCEQKPD